MPDIYSSGGSIVGAGLWIQHVLLGQAATTIAVLAIAAIGLAMLLGQINVRRASAAIIGCFLLFGAPVITNGLSAAFMGSMEGGAETTSAPSSRARPEPTSSNPFDPYAGTAAPQR